jgi:hypothetical protein
VTIFLGIALGVIFSLTFSYVFVLSRFQILRKHPCMTCGRPSHTLAQITNLETREIRAHTILCQYCLTKDEDPRTGWVWK